MMGARNQRTRVTLGGEISTADGNSMQNGEKNSGLYRIEQEAKALILKTTAFQVKRGFQWARPFRNNPCFNQAGSQECHPDESCCDPGNHSAKP